jgi:hypothetical protein
MDGEQKYSREEILAAVRNNKWRKIKQYKVAESLKPPLTRRQKYTLLSPIPRNLTALLTTNELMAGAQVEEFLSHLVPSNTIHGNGLWARPSAPGTVILG